MLRQATPNIHHRFSAHITAESAARHDAVHKFLHRWNMAIGVERIFREAIRIVAREHQLVLHITAMCNVLQRFLDAEAARIGGLARGEVAVL